MMAKFMIGVLFMLGFILEGHSVLGVYYGKQIGSLRTLAHQVRGTLHAADSKTLFITGFNYDGRGPDAFMWMGNTNSPGGQGTIIPVDGSPAQPEAVLEAYSNAVVRLDLPDGKTLADYKWLSIWCRRFGANFGDLLIPVGSTPVPVSLGTLGFTPYRVHNVFADDVIVLNNRQIKLVNLDYDGNGPDAYYWAGTGGTPSRQGFSLADESRGGSILPLPRGTSLNDVTVTITIPEERGDIFSIGHFGLWCDLAQQDFGHVDIPPTGVDISAVPRYEVMVPTQPPKLENCKVLLDDTYQVKWSVSGTNIQVSLSARINAGTYMAFGLSGSNERTQMFQSDVTVTWLDAATGTTPNAIDYYLSAYQQCVIGSGSGACTDELSNPSGTNDVTLIDSTNNNGIITITYERPLSTSDTNTDKVIPTNQAVYIAWAIGPINPSGLAAKHRTVPTSDVLINFGQTGETCPAFTIGEKVKLPAWEIPAIVGDERKTEFQLDIGQAGGEQGYEGITGSPGWGITWYVDNLMIPIITLKRGVTYTFTVNGGDDANNQARYHPFYITNDPEGGYFQKTTVLERQGITIYAGPTSGSLCEWRSSGSQNPDDFTTFEQYRDTTLQRVCDPPMQSRVMTWTPDANTPNLVFYQCYTHKFLGWKMYIVDGDQPFPESSPEPTPKPHMPKTTAKDNEQATKSPPMPNTTARNSGSPGNPDGGSPGTPGGGRDPDPSRKPVDEQIKATGGPQTTAGACIAMGSKMVVLTLIAISMIL